MRNPSELKIHRYPGEPTRDPPSEGLVSAFEREFGLSMPREYLDFISSYNGGCPEICVFQSTLDDFEEEWIVNHFYYFDSDRDGPESLWLATRVWRGVLTGNLLPFAEDPFGNPFLLDLQAMPPSVKVCAHDEANAIVEIAPNFESFIDALIPNVEEE